MEAMREAESAVRQGFPADAALARFLRGHRHLGSRDRRLIHDVVFAAFRWRGWTGALSDRGPRVLAEAAMIQSAGSLPDALRSIALSADLSREETPATDESTDDPVAWVNAAAQRAGRVLGRPCALESLLPEWFVARMRSSDPGTSDWLPRFIAWSRVRPPLWLRVLGTTAPDAALRIRKDGWDAEPSATHPDAVQIRGAPPLPTLLQRTRLRAFAQDLASQRIVAACRAQPGERWWDACAGAGGKTLGLLDAVGPSGEVRATDVRPTSLDELATRAQALQLSLPRMETLDASQSSPGDDSFDGVLVDAPCSGSGTWARNPDAPWRLAPDDLDRRLEVQRRILDPAARAVRKGGRLVYATCAVGRPENEDQTGRFIREHPEFRLDSSATLWPWDGPQNGSYYAVFVRER